MSKDVIEVIQQRIREHLSDPAKVRKEECNKFVDKLLEEFSLDQTMKAMSIIWFDPD